MHVQTKAATDSKADLEGEHKKHEEERQILVTKVTDLQTDNDRKSLFPILKLRIDPLVSGG